MNTLAMCKNQATRRGWMMGVAWAVLRIWVGYQFLSAGLQKLGNAAWTGSHAGVALSGFLHFATSPVMTTGAHPNVLMPYVWLSHSIFMGQATTLSYLVTTGECLVGIGLIVGVFTRAAALGGALLNINYLLAGSAGLNTPMLVIELSIVLSGTYAGLVGLDTVLLPVIRSQITRFQQRRSGGNTARGLSSAVN